MFPWLAVAGVAHWAMFTTIVISETNNFMSHNVYAISLLFSFLVLTAHLM